jgi:hypothetical protein
MSIHFGARMVSELGLKPYAHLEQIKENIREKDSNFKETGYLNIGTPDSPVQMSFDVHGRLVVLNNQPEYAHAAALQDTQSAVRWLKDNNCITDEFSREMYQSISDAANEGQLIQAETANPSAKPFDLYG